MTEAGLLSSIGNFAGVAFKSPFYLPEVVAFSFEFHDPLDAGNMPNWADFCATSGAGVLRQPSLARQKDVVCFLGGGGECNLKDICQVWIAC
ncbi:MAG: hypothetical protein KIT08_04460 [Anaerolineales bacterium]|nr:MAG: hypothetical protein KIT08_04460 [Anaerolineales bacterium]